MPELPVQLLNSLEGEPHFNRQNFVAAHQEGEKVTSIRMNPFKPASITVGAASPVPWCSGGFYLEERPVFTLDPYFHAGCYYVQEPGSMFLDHAIRTGPGDIGNFKVLDLCAAPGGKSTLLNSLLNENGLLVANELIRNRVPALVQNLGRWGTINSVVTNNEPERFANLSGFFDLLVIDAPCSGSGLFRKQPEAIEEWSEKNVQLCSVRQRDILIKALPALRDEGWLFYSTCSYSVEENEQIVAWLCEEHGCEFVPIPVDPAWGIVVTGMGYRFYPDQARSEGFFCALMRKKGGDTPKKSRKSGLTPLSQKDTSIISNYISQGHHSLISLQNRPHLVNKTCCEFLDLAANTHYFRKAGQFLGEIKGKDFVPSQDLAWSLLVSPNTERLDLDREDALLYLRKAGFPFPQGLAGLRLITFTNLGIGWGKFMPGRMNNYLPNELRILM